MPRFLANLSLACAIFLMDAALAQEPVDAVSLREALHSTRWEVDTVGPDVVLRRAKFESLFGAPQSLAVLRARRGSRVDVVPSNGLELTSTLAARHDALVAVNGGFFDTKNGDPVGLLRVDGALIRPANPGQGSVGITAAREVMLDVRPAGDWPKCVDALGAGPMLLTDGSVVDHGERQRKIRHPRSAIGLTSRGDIVLVVVDGRTPQAAGMSLWELGTVMEALGCRDALNLDGGGSSTMWVLGRGIVNHPCDNRRFDALGERKVANAVLLSGPVSIVIDEEAAEIASGNGGRREGIGVAVDGDVLVIEAGEGGEAAAAIYRVRAPRPGTYRVELLLPRLDDPQSARVIVTANSLRSTLDVSRTARDWRALGSLEFDESPLELRLESAEVPFLVVDAVRLTEQRRD